MAKTYTKSGRVSSKAYVLEKSPKFSLVRSASSLRDARLQYTKSSLLLVGASTYLRDLSPARTGLIARMRAVEVDSGLLNGERHNSRAANALIR
jgi:hypothetical protein